MGIWFYGIVATVISAVSFCLDNLRKGKIRYGRIICAIFASLFLIFIIGCRGANVGNDTANYLEIFTNSNTKYSLFQLLDGQYYEVGYAVLMRFVGLFTKDAHVALLLISIITLVPIVFAIYRYSETPWLSFALFFAMGFLFVQMNILRQSIVMGILILAFEALKKKKPIAYTACIILATLFHTTAVLGLIMIPFMYIRITRMKALCVLLCAVLIGLLFNPLLELVNLIFPKYIQHYGEGSYFDGSGWLGASFVLAIYCIMIALMVVVNPNAFNTRPHIKYSLEPNSDEIIENIFDWQIVGIIFMQIIAIVANLIDRLTLYFSIYLILSLPYYAKKIENKNQRIFFTAAIIALFLFKTVLILTVRLNWNRVLPYYFFWW